LVGGGGCPGPADARSREHKAQRSEQQDRREDRVQPDGLRDERGHAGDRSAAAARRAQQQNGGGRVLSVEPDGGGYRVKVLKDGEVRTHRVDSD
jgi:hypothetical protein